MLALYLFIFREKLGIRKQARGESSIGGQNGKHVKNRKTLQSNVKQFEALRKEGVRKGKVPDKHFTAEHSIA